MREKYFKLILVLQVLIFGFMVMPSGVISQTVKESIESINTKAPASKTKGINNEKNKKISSAKCWKRVWITSESYKGKSTLPVCKAFEEVLNTTCEPPEKLQCNWTLPTDEKRFKKLEWQTLEFKEYKNLVEEMTLGKDHKWRWYEKDAAVKKAFDDGTINIKMTTVDIDNNGKAEHVLHKSWLHDCPNCGQFAVINKETKQIDWRYDHLFLHANAHEGADIILYEGKAYMFGYTSQNYVGYKQPWKMIWVYEGFSLFEDTEFGSVNICQYKYLKGDNKK